MIHSRYFSGFTLIFSKYLVFFLRRKCYNGSHSCFFFNKFRRPDFNQGKRFRRTGRQGTIMRLEHLTYFAEVARCRSINRAAKNLYITQPALTLALNSLEEELGCRLLIRSHRGAFLTPQGERILADAEKILAIAAGWKDLNSRDEETGDVHIGANPAVYNYMLTPLQISLQETYPGLSIFSYEIKNQNILVSLENGSIALGIIFVLPSEEGDFQKSLAKKQLRAVPLYQDILDVFIGACHPLSTRHCLKTEDLASLSLALYPEQDDTISSPVFSRFFKNGRFYRFSGLTNILQVIQEGKAVGIFPRLMVQNSPQAKSGSILALPLCDFQVPLTFYLVTRDRESLSSACEKAKNAVIHACAGYPQAPGGDPECP